MRPSQLACDMVGDCLPVADGSSGAWEEFLVITASGYQQCVLACLYQLLYCILCCIAGTFNKCLTGQEIPEYYVVMCRAVCSIVLVSSSSSVLPR